MTDREKVVGSEADREQEQLQKLDKLRKLVQTILGNHLWLIGTVFVLVLGAMLGLVWVKGANSPTRYLARLTLCYNPKHHGKIGQYDDKYVLRILNRRSTRDAFASQSDELNGRRRGILGYIHIGMDRKQPHTFSIELSAASEAEAVAFINEFAGACIQEYSGERMRDLRQWKELLDAEKKAEGIEKKITDEAKEEARRIRNDADREAKDIADKLERAIAFDGKTNGRERILELGLDNNQIAERLIKVYKEVISS